MTSVFIFFQTYYNMKLYFPVVQFFGVESDWNKVFCANVFAERSSFESHTKKQKDTLTDVFLFLVPVLIRVIKSIKASALHIIIAKKYRLMADDIPLLSQWIKILFQRMRFIASLCQIATNEKVLIVIVLCSIY